MREFLYILMGRNNNIFCGPENCRALSHNLPEVFYYVGQMIAVSLVHGGTDTVADYIANGMTGPSVSSVPDSRF